jgi:hypothetical protein
VQRRRDAAKIRKSFRYGKAAAWRLGVFFLSERNRRMRFVEMGFKGGAVSRDVTSRRVGPRKGEACSPMLDSTSTAVH